MSTETTPQNPEYMSPWDEQNPNGDVVGTWNSTRRTGRYRSAQNLSLAICTLNAKCSIRAAEKDKRCPVTTNRLGGCLFYTHLRSERPTGHSSNAMKKAQAEFDLNRESMMYRETFGDMARLFWKYRHVKTEDVEKPDVIPTMDLVAMETTVHEIGGWRELSSSYSGGAASRTPVFNTGFMFWVKDQAVAKEKKDLEEVESTWPRVFGERFSPESFVAGEVVFDLGAYHVFRLSERHGYGQTSNLMDGTDLKFRDMSGAIFAAKGVFGATSFDAMIKHLWKWVKGASPGTNETKKMALFWLMYGVREKIRDVWDQWDSQKSNEGLEVAESIGPSWEGIDRMVAEARATVRS